MKIVDYREKNIKLLQEKIPSKNNYEAQEKYDRLMKNIRNRLRKSGQHTLTDNVMNILLEEFLKSNKQL